MIDIPKTTSEMLAKNLGVTMRQLQWWDERGVVMPSHVDHCRWYSPHQAAEVAAIAALRRSGLSLQMIRRSLTRLRLDIVAEMPALAEGRELYIVVSRNGRRLLCTRDLYQAGEFAAETAQLVTVARIGVGLCSAWFGARDGIVRRKLHDRANDQV